MGQQGQEPCGRLCHRAGLELVRIPSPWRGCQAPGLGSLSRKSPGDLRVSASVRVWWAEGSDGAQRCGQEEKAEGREAPQPEATHPGTPGSLETLGPTWMPSGVKSLPENRPIPRHAMPGTTPLWWRPGGLPPEHMPPLVTPYCLHLCALSPHCSQSHIHLTLQAPSTRAGAQERRAAGRNGPRPERRRGREEGASTTRPRPVRSTPRPPTTRENRPNPGCCGEEKPADCY